MQHPIPHEPPPQDFAHKVLDRIEEERLTPRPKWQFRIKEGLFWLFWIVSILIGSLLAAAMLFAFANAGWEYRLITHQNLFGFVMQVLPTVWIVALIGALLLAYENFRHTARGYRLPLAAVIGFSLLGTMLGGFLLYIGGAGRAVEEGLGARLPIYRPVMQKQKQLWTSPEQGLLAGEVVDYDRERLMLRLRSFNGDIYLMSAQALADDSRDLLVEREPVRIVGVFAKPTDGPETPFFRPCYVFPWEPKRPGVFRVACGDERSFEEPRSTECKGLVPYEILKTLRRGACR